jgi:uncharacterized protein
MSREIFVSNKQSEAMHGTLQSDYAKKMVIICHGLADTESNPVLVALCEALERENISSFRFSFSGNGKSEGVFIDSTYHKERDDLQEVLVDFMEKGVKEFCLVGHSMGGGVVKVVAANNDAVKALVCLAGVSKAGGFEKRFPELMKQINERGQGFLWQERYGDRFPITMKYIDSAATIPLEQAAINIHCPVLCVQGDGDRKDRATETREWLSHLPNDAKSLFIILPGVDHFFNRFEQESKAEEGKKLLLNTVIPWVQSNF